MIVTHEMVHAGVDKALGLGLLPRTSIPEDFATNSELMEEILRAALNVADEDMSLIFESENDEMRNRSHFSHV